MTTAISLTTGRTRACMGLLVFLMLAPLKVVCGADDNNRYLGQHFARAEFAKLPAERIEIGKHVLLVAFAPGDFSMGKAPVLDWVAQSAESVTTYFGRLPAPEVMLLVVPVPGRGVHGGKAWGDGGAAIRILLGQESTPLELQSDWVLVHELTHLALPALPDQQHWMEEGIATYVEPIARAQTGRLDAKSVWLDLMRGLPKGLPGEGDGGLDRTPTWGRIYWGGASFWLLADIEIRKRTANRKGLQHALRAIIEEGGNISTRWSVSRLLSVGDRATGTAVLRQLYREMGQSAMPIDLARLWRELGVSIYAGGLQYDDDAPLANIRRAITAPP